MGGRLESCRAVVFASRIGKVGFAGTSSLVAPVKTGQGAVIGWGPVITKNAPENALAMERNAQTTRGSGAKRYHELKTKAKVPKGG